jgi:hypothetical protein
MPRKMKEGRSAESARYSEGEAICPPSEEVHAHWKLKGGRVGEGRDRSEGL